MAEADYNTATGGPLDALDEQLRRMGIDPLTFAKLPPVSLGGGAAPKVDDLLMRTGEQPRAETLPTRPGSQPPPISLTNRPANALPAPLERLKENPQNTFNLPVVSFAKPAPQQGSQYDGVVPLRPEDRGWLKSARANEQLLKEQDADRGIGAQDAAARSASGPPAVSFTATGNASGGTQGSTSPAGASNSNAGGFLAAARANGEATAPGSSGVQPHIPEDEYRDLLKTEPTRDQFPAEKMALWKKLLGAVASTASGIRNPELAGQNMRRIMGGPEQKAEQKFEQAHSQWESKAGSFLKAANLHHQEMEDKNLQSEIDARNRSKTEKPENLDREAYDYYVGQGMTPAEARKRVLQDAESVKPERQTHTSPFEAFAYGSPEEKKAAQDFLDVEKRLGTKYRNPTEFEEKYRLFKEDPETYRSMFGDKTSGGPDRATATKMLNYFDKRRREVNSDFTLDDDQKKEQLQEIENLERPFMEAAQPGPGRGGNNERVEVIHPNGQHGTIPRSQLDAAKKKGYREAQP